MLATVNKLLDASKVNTNVPVLGEVVAVVNTTVWFDGALGTEVDNVSLK